MWANPSSPHSEGRAARAALEQARARVATALDWDGEILFTSGASEAIAPAALGCEGVAGSADQDALLSVVAFVPLCDAEPVGSVS